MLGSFAQLQLKCTPSRFAMTLLDSSTKMLLPPWPPRSISAKIWKLGVVETGLILARSCGMHAILDTAASRSSGTKIFSQTWRLGLQHRVLSLFQKKIKKMPRSGARHISSSQVVFPREVSNGLVYLFRIPLLLRVSVTIVTTQQWLKLASAHPGPPQCWLLWVICFRIIRWALFAGNELNCCEF